MNYRLPYNGKWHLFDDDMLLNKCTPKDAEQLRELYAQYQKNRMAFFLAHPTCPDSLAFLNDTESDICALLGTNRGGKTYHGIQWLCMRIMPSDPTWHCYTHHGLKYIPFRGGDFAAYIGTYSLKVLRRAIWSTLCEIAPEDILKEYHPRYKGPGKKRVSWTGDCSLPLDYGSLGSCRIDFSSYSQGQSSVESVEYPYALSDEQMPRPMLIGLIERGRTCGGIKIAACATPHRMKGRPDTGAGGWLHNLVLGTEGMSGGDTLGRKVKIYRIPLKMVPDALYPKDEKEKAIREHITIPTQNQDYKALREGLARLNAEFESAGGACLDEWDPKIHLIGWDDFERVHGKREIPKDWTRYRASDPALKGVCAGLCAAIAPDGDMYLYAEYYARNKSLGENVAGMLEMSGNTRRLLCKKIDSSGVEWPIYEEVCSGTKFVASVMDPATFGSKSDSGLLIGQMYNQFGIRFAPASGVKLPQMLPVMNQWLARNPEKPHKYFKNSDGTPVMGAPKCYVLNTLRFWQMEAINWVDDPKTLKPAKEHDHLTGSCFRYILLCGPRYYGDDVMRQMGAATGNARLKEKDVAPVVKNEKVRPYTGYE